MRYHEGALLPRTALSSTDCRRQDWATYSLAAMAGQSIYALVVGDENLIDYDRLRDDPLQGRLAGGHKPGRAQASKSPVPRPTVPTDQTARLAPW